MGSFLNNAASALTPQNKFNAASALNTGALANNVAQSQTGLQGALGGEQNVANLLLQQASGNGPNLAQMQLQQNTENAIKQNSGMIASERGISPALAARMAAQGAAQQTQAAAGQSAQLGAQQQLSATQQLGGLYGNIANQNIQNTQTTGGLANQAALGVQGINAAGAAQNAAANQNTAGGILNSVGGAISNFLSDGGEVRGYDSGGWVSTGTQDVTNDPTSPFNQQPDAAPVTPSAGPVNPAAQAQAAAPDQTMPGSGSGTSPAQSNPFSAFSSPKGQVSASSKISDQMLAAAGIPIYAAGNSNMQNLNFNIKPKPAPGPLAMAGGPMDNPGSAAPDLSGGASALGPSMATMTAAYGKLVPHMKHIAHLYHGDKVKAMVSPGEIYLDPKQARQVAMGNMSPMAGKKFQGKAQVKGDSPRNDIIKADLESGGVVVKRSKVQAGEEEARNFVAEKLKEGNPHEDFHEALKKAIGARKNA